MSNRISVLTLTRFIRLAMPSSGRLALSTLLFWGLIVPPVRYLLDAGISVYLLSAVAGLICLAPALATLIWAEIVFAGKPDTQILVYLASSVIRMLFVSGVALLLSIRFAYFQDSAFVIWLAVFYLFVLGVETYLVAVQRARTFS
jgi:hypothetical protein